MLNDSPSPGEALQDVQYRSDLNAQGILGLFRSPALFLAASASRLSALASARSYVPSRPPFSSSNSSVSSLYASPPPLFAIPTPPEATTYSVAPVIPMNPLSLRQKLLYVALNVGLRYVWTRLRPLYQSWSLYPLDHWKRTCARIYQFLETSYRTLAMINFCVFLADGRYRDVLDRIIGVRLVYLRSRVMRQVAFDFMNQQLVWQGFSEFFLFLLPFIDFERIRSGIRKLLRLSSDNQEEKGCPVCKAPPTTPYQANCGHVFCYYCLHGSRLQDDMFRCPGCDVLIRSQEPFLPPRPPR